MTRKPPEKKKPEPDKDRKKPVPNSKEKKTSQKEIKKLKTEKEIKENKQARGFWAKYAETRRKLKENCENNEKSPTQIHTAPGLESLDRSHCNSDVEKSVKVPSTPVHRDQRVTAHVACESETSKIKNYTWDRTEGGGYK